MNNTELKVARVRRNVSGKELAIELGVTVDGYFKKEHGNARITLQEAGIIANHLKLTFKEFLDIFFEGNLPLCQYEKETYEFGNDNKLKRARERVGLTLEYVAEKLGVSVLSVRQRETGRCKVSIEQAKILTELYALNFDEFNDVFFDTTLQFGK